MSRAKVTDLRVKLMSRAKVTELRVKLMSRARLSKTYLVVSDQSKGDLERSSRDQARQCFASRPQDFQWSTTRTEQGSCLLTIPVLVEGDSFGPAKQYLPGQVTFWRTHADTTYNTAPEPGCIVRQSLSKFYLRQLTEGEQTARERT